MARNPLRQLTELGQSVWLDGICRRWLADGALARLIGHDGVSGCTTNPAIFERAVAHERDYADSIVAGRRAGKSGTALYESLAIEDMRRAADLLRPVYESSAARDGYVGLEVSPELAYRAQATIDEARRLWACVARPNLMIQVPGTPAGASALRVLVASSINVNATLLYSVAQYRRVLQAHREGVADALHSGVSPGISVASFVLSRLDTLVDRQLDDLGAPPAAALRGQAATACAWLAYQELRSYHAERGRQASAGRDAGQQRLLWVATAAGGRRDSSMKYLDALVAPGTIAAVPLETMATYRDHGNPSLCVAERSANARVVVMELRTLGLDLGELGEELQFQGVRKFGVAHRQLIAAVDRTAKKLEASADGSRTISPDRLH
jgi:transaldolase